MAYLGRRGALAPLTSADIPVGIVEGTDIAFLENASGTQNLGGTYSTERMYLNDSYTLTGDVTVTGHLALGSIADEDIVITQDSTERTITGSGTLDAGNVLQDTHGTDLTGMTGVLGSAVTGSPNLNLTTGTLGSGVTFPADHIVQVVSSGYLSAGTSGQGISATVLQKLYYSNGSTSYNKQITVTSGNKVFVQVAFGIEMYGTPAGNNIGGGFGLGWNNGSTDATLVLNSDTDTFFQNNSSYTALYQSGYSINFLHTPDVTNPTYFLQGYSRASTNSIRVGWQGCNFTLMEIQT
jgi:hypothetical protein